MEYIRLYYRRFYLANFDPQGGIDSNLIRQRAHCPKSFTNRSHLPTHQEGLKAADYLPNASRLGAFIGLSWPFAYNSFLHVCDHRSIDLRHVQDWRSI